MMTMCWIGPATDDTGPPDTGTVLMGEVSTGAVLTFGATPEPHPADKNDSSRKTLLPRRENIRPPSELKLRFC